MYVGQIKLLFQWQVKVDRWRAGNYRVLPVTGVERMGWCESLLMPDGWARAEVVISHVQKGVYVQVCLLLLGVYILKLINRPLFTHSHTRVQHTCTHIPVMTGISLL